MHVMIALMSLNKEHEWSSVCILPADYTLRRPSEGNEALAIGVTSSAL